MTNSTETTLRNGCKVLQQRGAIVLAATGTDYTPYVTWTVDADGHAYWGHYFEKLTEAAADFEARSAGCSL